MKLFSLMSSLLFLTLSMSSSWAQYNSEIDVRTNIQIMMDNAPRCTYYSGGCENNKNLYTKLSATGASKILQQSSDKSYFIPFNIKNEDSLILVGALSLGTIIFANDREIMDFVQNNKTERTQKVADIANLFGREAIIPLVAGSYFMGAVMDNGKLKQIGLIAIPVALATQLTTEIFKKTFKRTRPNGTDSPYDFFEDGYSFFSGHTSGAFSLATVIAEVYKDHPVVPYLAYGVATLTAYARMHDQKHWATDVLAGAVAGHLITKIMMRTFENSESGGFVVTPMIGAQYGFNITWTPKNPNSGNLKCSKSNSQGSDLIRECMDEVFARGKL